MTHAAALHAASLRPGERTSWPTAHPLPLSDCGRSAPHLSFEMFPPKTDAQEAQFWECARRLEALRPEFVSVTYGAGGTTQARTLAVVEGLAGRTGLAPAAHLTCVGATRAEVDAVARRYWAAGVRRIVALRGDMPGGGAYVPHPGGYAYAADLVAGLRRVADFDISVAAYPETHPAAASAAADLDNLRRKLDAGASRAITQYFFEPDAFLRFLDRARAAGITAPIVPGILPVTNFVQVAKFSAACGARVPDWLARLFAGLEDDAETRRMIAAIAAAEMLRVLMANGINEFHFYTLNRADLVTTMVQLARGAGAASV